jgi:hypothetical protein
VADPIDAVIRYRRGSRSAKKLYSAAPDVRLQQAWRDVRPRLKAWLEPEFILADDGSWLMHNAAAPALEKSQLALDMMIRFGDADDRPWLGRQLREVAGMAHRVWEFRGQRLKPGAARQLRLRPDWVVRPDYWMMRRTGRLFALASTALRLGREAGEPAFEAMAVDMIAWHDDLERAASYLRRIGRLEEHLPAIRKRVAEVNIPRFDRHHPCSGGVCPDAPP